MKLIIAGSRSITDYSLLCRALTASNFLSPPKLLHPSDLLIVSGGARGIDRLAEQWARNNHVPCAVFCAEWDKHGLSAGSIRNKQMAEYANSLLAIWDGKSRGTLNMIQLAHKYDLDTYIYRLSDDAQAARSESSAPPPPFPRSTPPASS